MKSVLVSNLQTISGVLAAAASYLWGGFPLLLEVLFVMMVADFITGLMAGWVERKLSSKVGREGIARKVLAPVLVATAHFTDVILGTGSAFRDGMAVFYIVNEMISIVENAGRAGLPIPEKFQKAIELLREKGEDKNDRENLS